MLTGVSSARYPGTKKQMSNTNNIAASAVSKLNEQKYAQTVEAAQAKIAYILKEKQAIKGFEENIAKHQEILKGFIEDQIVASVVLGREASLNPTPSEVVILTAIAKRNDEKAKSQATNSKSHVDAIDGYQSAIKGCNERIDKMRKEISELVTPEVTVAEILG